MKRWEERLYLAQQPGGLKLFVTHSPKCVKISAAGDHKEASGHLGEEDEDKIHEIGPAHPDCTSGLLYQHEDKDEDEPPDTE